MGVVFIPRSRHQGARLGALICAQLAIGCASADPAELGVEQNASVAADLHRDAGTSDAGAPGSAPDASVHTEAICPLLGLGYHNPATLQPELRIVGTDMGVPVELGDSLYLVFGDTWTDLDVCGPVEEPYLTLDSDDLLGRVAMEPRPDPDACLEIEFPELPDDPSKFPPLQLQHQGQAVGLLEISVATAAFAHDGRLYAFFNPFGDATCAEDADCAAPARCGGGVCTYGGMPTLPPRIFAVAEPDAAGRPGPHFTGLSELASPHFTSLTARTVDGLDDPTQEAPSQLLLFGRPHYLAGLGPGTDRAPWGLYLLHQPLAELGATGQLRPRYFAGMDDDGAPTWSEQAPRAASIVDPESERAGDGEPIWFMGTMSVSAIPAFGPEGYRWLLTYGGRPPTRVDVHGQAGRTEAGIYYRLARHPWGPWTDPALLYSAHGPGGYGELLYRPQSEGIASDDNRAPRQCSEADVPYDDYGVEYAPQVLETFTRVRGDTLTVYWLLSTWNPYRVVQMRSELTLAPE